MRAHREPCPDSRASRTEVIVMLRSRICSGLKARVPMMLIVLLLVSAAFGCDPSYRGLTTEQKLEDFRYLFNLFGKNHGTISITARMTGFDWLAHREEFEEEVKRTKDDKEFAVVMRRLLCLTMDKHTKIQSRELVANFGLPQMPSLYREIAREKGLEEATEYWFDLAYRQNDEPRYMWVPAMYHAGEYAVVKEFSANGTIIRPGYRIIEVDGTPVDEYVAGHLGDIYLSWDPVRRKTYEDPLRVPVQRDTVTMLFRDLSGNLVEVKLSTKDLPPWHFGRCPIYSSSDGVVLRQDLFVKVFSDLAAYIRVSYMFDWSQEDLSRFREFLDSVKDLPAIIIDIRGNPGGTDMCWIKIVQSIAANPVSYEGTFLPISGEYDVRTILPGSNLGAYEISEISKSTLIRYLTPEESKKIAPEFHSTRFMNLLRAQCTLEPEDSINYRGRVYVLVDDITGSAAVNLTYFCKDTGWATLVGTWPGGAFGFSPAVATLPNSRMVLRFPIGFGLNRDLTANDEFPTMPDVLVEDYEAFLRAYTALANGERHSLDPEYDPVLAACLELIKKQGR